MATADTRRDTQTRSLNTQVQSRKSHYCEIKVLFMLIILMGTVNTGHTDTITTHTTTISDITPLRDQGLVYVDYPNDVRKAVQDMITSWMTFCELPTEVKSTFSFLTDTHGDGTGYELKNAPGGDPKENFHYTLNQHERLANIASENNHTFHFIDGAKALLERIRPLVLEAAAKIEKEFQIHGLVEDVQQSEPYWTIRYLHYFGDQEEGKVIAAPHLDKGGFTLHLYESDEGLEYYCLNERSWKPMPVNDKETVIFAAMQLQLLTQGNAKALCHQVETTKITAKTGRFSAVLFVTLQNTPMYNKQAYGSMQTHPVGFNYDISHEDFEQLFLK